MTNPCFECGACCRDMVFGDTGENTIKMLRVMGYPLVFATLQGGVIGLKITGKCPMLDENNRCMMFSDGSEYLRPLDCMLVEVGGKDCTRHRAKIGLPPIDI